MNSRPHFAFVVLGNAFPVLAGLWGGLHAGDILVLLYAESLVGALLTGRRVATHRRLSRRRGHFRCFEESDGTLRAAGFAFRSTLGACLFMYGVYALFVWMLYTLYEFKPDPDLVYYALLSAGAPILEYLVERPGMAGRSFAWIEKRSQETGGRLLAFGVLIPVGGVGLMFGNVIGGVVMAGTKALVESLWGAALDALRQGRKVLPGLDSPGIQKAWQRAVSEYAETTAGSEEVLDERTWHRMMKEAAGEFDHVKGRSRRMGERATFASDRKPAADEPAAAARADQPTQVFHARSQGQTIELAQGDDSLARISMPGSLQLWSGTLAGQAVKLKVAAPWNRFTWQLCAGERVLATAKQPRALGLLRMPSTFRVKLSAGEFYWTQGGDLTPGWQLMAPDGETVHGRSQPGAPEGYDETIEVPATLSAADALFLVWLRWQSGDMHRRGQRPRRRRNPT